MAEGEFEGREMRVGVAAPAEQQSDGVPRQRLEAFCQALSELLRMPVFSSRFTDYSDLQHAIIGGSIDLAWLPPLVGVRVVTSGHGVPVALPVRGGNISYWSALFSAPQSTIRCLDDLRSVRSVWVDRNSTSGYRVIRAWLRAEGVDVSTAFREERFVGSHANVAQAVAQGPAIVGATYAHLSEDRRRIVRAGWGHAKVNVIGLAGPIPSDIVTASTRLPVKITRAIQRALALDATGTVARTAATLLEADGFVLAESEHLSPLGKLLDHLDDSQFKSIPPPR